jgi:glycosyltransferase involved in cell wall biosynthesis
MYDLSIVIPAYNESARLAMTLPRVVNWAAKSFDRYELLVVDDGSADYTAYVARSFGARVIDQDHLGKAFAVMNGIIYAHYPFTLVLDADVPVKLDTVLPLVSQVVENRVSVCYGSRGMNRPGSPAWRKLMARGMVYTRKFILPELGPIVDTQCGCKAFVTLDAINVINNLAVFGWSAFKRGEHVPGVQAGFDVEFLYVAQRLGLRCTEWAVDWKHEKTNRVGLRDAVKGFQDLLLIRAAASSGMYNRLVIA